MANKRKRSRKENKAIHAKKRKDFDIWAHQRDVGRTLRRVQRKNPKGHVWEDYTAQERKKLPKTGPFLPEF